MRTLLIIVVLLGVSMLAAASFVLEGGAQQPDATLDYACDPMRIPANVDTLVRCRAVVTNTGQEPLPDVRLQFEPAPSVPSPDRWYFFGARLDGSPFEVDRGQLNYDLGDIAPGEQRVLDLDVILRVSAPSGAVVSLYSASDGTRLTQQLVVIEPEDAPPPVTIDLQLTQDTDDLRRFHALLTVTDATRAIDILSADLGLQDHMSVPDAYARQQPFLGEDVFGPKFHLTTMLLAPPSPAGPPVSIGFEIFTDEPCQGGSLALVGYVHAPDGTVARPSLVTELPIDPACYTADGASPNGVTSLGQGGFGPEQPDVEAAVTLFAMLAGILGFATAGMAIFLVR